MCQQRGIEVERQGKSTTPWTVLSFGRAAMGGIQRDTLQSRLSALQCLCYTMLPVGEMVSGIVCHNRDSLQHSSGKCYKKLNYAVGIIQSWNITQILFRIWSFFLEFAFSVATDHKGFSMHLAKGHSCISLLQVAAKSREQRCLTV